ncbi:MAG: serine hydrolase [Flavobacteriales bacterium]|nr:serine hydrolase [Flavobacteriales bacterium]
MKFLRIIFRSLFGLSIILILACLILYITDNAHLIKAVRNTYLLGKTGPTIDDYPKFENRIVSNGTEEPWNKNKLYNHYQPSSEEVKALEEMKSSAFLVIKNNELLFEKYWETYSNSSMTNSFSMAKSFTSLCIGAAIKEGKIKSVEQKVSDFIPEFKEEEKLNISIKDLLTMSSGINFGESNGDPFGFMAKVYYGENLYDLTVQKPVKFDAGKTWHYQGGNSLLLSFILKKATGLSLSEYFSTHFWKPLGTSKDALWTLNKLNGMEKSYCCFYSNARDYAKIGQLMLDSGRWNGKELIQRDYFNASIAPVNIPDESGKLIDYYGYQWWLGSHNGIEFYYARGIQGQYIVSVPSWNVVFVRLGHKRDPTRGVKIPSDLFTYFDLVEHILE